MFSLIMCIGTWPGPSMITLHVVLPRDLRELAERIEFAELRFVVGIGKCSPDASPSPSENVTS